MNYVFMIRAQGLGIVTDKVYSRTPSQAEMEAVLAKELELHGLDKEGKPRDRWVQAFAVELVGESELLNAPNGIAPLPRMLGKLDAEGVKALQELKKANPVGGRSEAPMMTASGTATVTNPK